VALEEESMSGMKAASAQVSSGDSENAVEIRKALEAHWAASSAGDQEAEHAIYDEDVVCDYPQSGERIQGSADGRQWRILGHGVRHRI
jgi:hypothetical protein